MINSSVIFGVDYHKTAEMRLQLAITKIQESNAMASFIEESRAKLVEWQNYYSSIKPLIDIADYEGVFNVPVPA